MEPARKEQAAPAPLATRDGHPVQVTAAVSTLEDALSALAADAPGIGLFSTESFYRTRDTIPTEEDLLAVYGALAAAGGSRPAVIRLPDLDWHEWPDHEPESNPALGRRGIRLVLAEPTLASTQLRAVLRAGAAGPLGIALPFVSAVSEVLAVKSLITQLGEELTRDGVPWSRPSVGLMADLPAVVAASDIMACEASFYHVGDTMIRYLMGTDQTDLDPLEPAFLLQCRLLLENLHRRHKKVAVSARIVCEPAAVPVLIGLGFDELAVPHVWVTQTMELVRQTHFSAARLVAAKMVSFWDPCRSRQYAEDALTRDRI